MADINELRELGDEDLVQRVADLDNQVCSGCACRATMGAGRDAEQDA